MKIKHLEIDGFEDFIELMKGKVFHTTTQESFESIVTDGGLIANISGDRPSVFGNSNGFFRLRGCISFFDYRELSDARVSEHLYKCVPTRIADDHKIMVVLVLSHEAYPDLESWISWSEEGAYSLKVVPRIEIGYPNFVPLGMISEVLTVSIIS
ncbi:hypothetical protein MHO82_25505 [Vibrio sp. Of7-15]|uniref:hypothetical protein n=1 Tax=Vibrio sp. Of7-15 TaxID=2724879 RepID=UPI001EF18FE2|nr:hypothetical protein [Vibrio sp. Of7-15]MCG7500208.1 hypothetical protein [Vibrio sp. Of7-15]